jgi:hypothetical protein
MGVTALEDLLGAVVELTALGAAQGPRPPISGPGIGCSDSSCGYFQRQHFGTVSFVITTIMPVHGHQGNGSVIPPVLDGLLAAAKSG